MKKLKKLLAAGAVIPALAFTLTACSGSAAAVSGIKDSKETVNAAGGKTPDCCEGKDETKAAVQEGGDTHKAAGGDVKDCCSGE